MLVPEPGRAFAECRRVLRPGRRLVYGVWGAFDRNPWLTHLVAAIIQSGHAIPGDPFGTGGPFSLASPEANRDLLMAAGFVDVENEDIPGAMRYASLDDYWDMQTAIAGPVAGVVRSLPDDERAAIKTKLEPTLTPYRSGDGYDFPSLAIGISAE
jgi:SAM-dependent methyltransferase